MRRLPQLQRKAVLARLAHTVHRRRGRFIALWVLLTLFGVFATAKVSNRWFESFSIPGYSAYETNQKVLKTFGTGEQAPLVAVFHSSGDVTKQDLAPGNPESDSSEPWVACQLLLRHAQRHVRLEGPPHDRRQHLPAWPADLLEGAEDQGGPRCFARECSPAASRRT
jgi:hypothetical protein